MTDTGLADQDERANVEGICGHITRSGRFEWICIRLEHASTDRPWLNGRHYMVNRWPNRLSAPALP